MGVSTEFPVGAIVRLVSGGPKMTVVGHGDGVVFCRWFAVLNEEAKHDHFCPATLRLVADPEPALMFASPG